MISVEFTIPANLWLSANDRRHWADKADRTRRLRYLGAWCTRDQGAGGPFGTTHVAAFIGYPRNGRADPANAAPTVKALIDGMVDAGVWPDDDSTYVIGPTYLRDKASGQAGVHTVRLVLTEQDIPLKPLPEVQAAPALTAPMIASATDIDQLREWHRQHPGQRAAIEARVAEIRAAGDGS